MDANMQHSNVALLMYIWEAFNRGDLEIVNKIVFEDIVYRVSGLDLPLGCMRTD